MPENHKFLYLIENKNKIYFMQKCSGDIRMDNEHVMYAL